MPWYAQRAGLPDTHKLWADPGSQHEAVLAQLGYVEVAAPGATADTREVADEQPVEAVPDVPSPPDVTTPKPRGRSRS
jgi:hypothetical protein